MHAAMHEALRTADRRWAALLRARARRLLRRLPRRERSAARFLAVLLHCSFRHPGLAEVAPGVVGLGAGRRWGELARSFGLPSPHAAQHGRRLVQAVWIVPAGAATQLAVVPVPGLAPAERRLLEARVAIAARLLGERAPHVALHEEVDAGALLFGGLLAGAALAPSSEPIAPAAWAARASSPLSALLLSLVPFADPLQSFLGWAAAVPALRLADDELFAALWARWTNLAGALPLEVAAVGGSHEDTRRAALQMCGAARPAIEVGRALVVAVARQRRWLPAAIVRELRGDMLALGMPAALLPALEREVGFSGEAVLERPARGGRAMLRHLALRARLGLLPEGDPFWRQVAVRLQVPGADAAVAKLGFLPAEGPPFDPLNRGPDARLCLAPGALVRMRAGRVRAPRSYHGPGLLEALLAVAAEGTPCDLVADAPAAAPLAGRLDRLLRRCGEVSGGGGVPLAVEAGGRALLVARGGLRRFAMDRFLTRPRRYAVDEDAPVLGGTSCDVAHAIECTISTAPGGARLVYGGEGLRFGETVPLGTLDAHLRETRALLAGEAALLVRHAGGGLQLPSGDSSGGAVAVTVGGDLARGLWIEVLGERFGCGEHWRWEAAASAIAAAWPVATSAPLTFPHVRVRVRGRRARPIEQLYARSVARRRLWIHLRRVLGT